MIVDSYRNIETPEGVELSLRIAGPVVRAYAWFIDFLIRAAIYFAMSFFLSFFGNFGGGMTLIAIFVIEWFYPIYFEVRKRGMTPGKKALAIRVVMENGSEVTWQASFIRNLLRAVDFIPLFYGFGLVTMLCNAEFKRLGDIGAGTLVVYQHDLGSALDIPQLSPQAPPVTLNAVEQKSIIQFAERASTLNPERCAELANILTDLTHAKNDAATNKLVQYANWMMGRR